MESNHYKLNLINSISSDVIEIESMLNALKQIKADIVIFSPYSTNNVVIDAPNFANYLKEQTIIHYTIHLEKLKKDLDYLSIFKK